ncbi:ABC transporter substrate-binding protein [Hungatella effluvii]|uniref:ABC transporter substrate-binding protein n=1 Tax=Hungatella effluvii TaxID=1096246 RepID=UPI002A83917B|nr:extracellular solute-binding protein [Hungatella effluvii]
MSLKKVAAICCCLSLAGGLLTGCGNNQNANQEDGNSVRGTNEISGSLTIWEHDVSFEAPLEAVIEGFSQKYPEIEIDYETKDGNTYYSLLTTSIQSGEAPDLFWTNGNSTSNMKDLAANDALMDLTEIVDYSDLEESSLALGRVNGKMYSVPWMSFDTRCCYYNKEIFEKEGWQVPGTFQEFETLLEKQKAAGYIPISLSPNNTWCILFAYEPIQAAMNPEYAKGLEGYSVKATDQPAADSLNKMLEWKNKGYFGENCMGVTDGNAQILAFTTGKAVMDIAGSWDNTTITDNNPDLQLGAFQIPAEDGTKGMVGSFANGFSVYKDTPNKEAAQAFIKYCASIEAQTAWVQTLGAVSGSSKIEASSEIANEISDADVTYISWQSLLANNAKEGESATTIWEEDSPKLFSGEVTVDELLAELSKVMQ